MSGEKQSKQDAQASTSDLAVQIAQSQEREKALKEALQNEVDARTQPKSKRLQSGAMQGAIGGGGGGAAVGAGLGTVTGAVVGTASSLAVGGLGAAAGAGVGAFHGPFVKLNDGGKSGESQSSASAPAIQQTARLPASQQSTNDITTPKKKPKKLEVRSAQKAGNQNA